MAEIFRCPSCSAPLKFQGKIVQTCKFCDSDVIVPSELIKPQDKINAAFDLIEPQDEDSEIKPRAGEEILRDASALGQKAVKIAEIRRAIKDQNKLGAAMLFRDNFGGGLADAKDVIEAIENGESVEIPDLQSEKAKSFPSKWIIILIAVSAMILMLILLFSFGSHV